MLPKINMPVFECELPSGRTVKFRPFSVKEEKILLIAKESLRNVTEENDNKMKDITPIVDAIKQIVNNTIIGDSQIEKMPLYDLIFYMSNLRARTVSNVVEMTILDPETKEKVDLEISLDNIEVHRPEGFDPKIRIDDQTMIIMRPPSINEVISLATEKSDSLAAMNIMLKCVEKIAHEDSVYLTAEVSDEELSHFFNSLPKQAIDDIASYFEKMPIVQYKVPYMTSKGPKSITIQGLEAFFMSG